MIRGLGVQMEDASGLFSLIADGPPAIVEEFESNKIARIAFGVMMYKEKRDAVAENSKKKTGDENKLPYVINASEVPSGLYDYIQYVEYPTIPNPNSSITDDEVQLIEEFERLLRVLILRTPALTGDEMRFLLKTASSMETYTVPRDFYTNYDAIKNTLNGESISFSQFMMYLIDSKAHLLNSKKHASHLNEKLNNEDDRVHEWQVLATCAYIGKHSNQDITGICDRFAVDNNPRESQKYVMLRIIRDIQANHAPRREIARFDLDDLKILDNFLLENFPQIENGLTSEDPNEFEQAVTSAKAEMGKIISAIRDIDNFLFQKKNISLAEHAKNVQYLQRDGYPFEELTPNDIDNILDVVNYAATLKLLTRMNKVVVSYTNDMMDDLRMCEARVQELRGSR